jgi:hypothetical protein
VLAVADVPSEAVLRQIEQRCNARLVLARATTAGVRCALERLYPATVSAA